MFAGGGIEIGANFAVDNVDGLLGYGLNVGAASSGNPLGGPNFAAEINFSIATEKNEGELFGTPTGAGDNGGGLTVSIPQLGASIGFLGYLDVSYTSEIARYSQKDLLNSVDEFIKLITNQFGKLSTEMEKDIRSQLEKLNNSDEDSSCETNCNE